MYTCTLFEEKKSHLDISCSYIFMNSSYSMPMNKCAHMQADPKNSLNKLNAPPFGVRFAFENENNNCKFVENNQIFVSIQAGSAKIERL